MDAHDYSAYTFRQLYEALESIRGDLYPDALTALDAEIHKRLDVSKPELEEAYFRLDHARYPEHERRLAALINAQGGFDTIAPEVVTSENRYQTGWRRVWAFVFDFLLLQIVLGVSATPLLKQHSGDVVVSTAITFGSQIIALFYFVLMHASCGQTLGKMITGVRVVTFPGEDGIGIIRALLREVVPLVLLAGAILALPHSDIIVGTEKAATLKPPMLASGIALLTLIWGFLEILTMLFSKKRRAAHDLMARTIVVRYLRTRPAEAGKMAAIATAGQR